MRIPFQSQPKSLADRALAAAGDAVDFARSVPERLEGGRERALAVAGAAAGVAAGLAFRRSRSGNEHSVRDAPAQMPTPWKTAPPPGGPAAKKPTASAQAKKPVTSSKDAAESAAGSRSK